jgi:hypothetical protein
VFMSESGVKGNGTEKEGKLTYSEALAGGSF